MRFSQIINLPNSITLINLLSGCMAIVFLFSYQPELVPYCVLVSLVADFLDGFAARLTGTATGIGKELDSLADVVSFGLVPGGILFQMLYNAYRSDMVNYPEWQMLVMAMPGFLVTLFAALRLAKFNLDTRQRDVFLGLATPAASLFVVGLLLIFQHNSFGLGGALLYPPLLYGIIIALCALMISELPMFSFKFKSANLKENRAVYLFIILSVVLLGTLKFASVSLIIIFYILFSIISKLIKS